MSLCKMYLKYLLYRLGMRRTIPAPIINRIEICENGEPLVNIRDERLFCFGGDLQSADAVLVRAAVVQKLCNVARRLPDGVRLKIYSAYRSMDSQRLRWADKWAENKRKFPDVDDVTLEKITRAQVACPQNNGFGGHQTGGAVDVSLCDEFGKDLDMGTLVREQNELTPTCSVVAKRNKTVRENRELLYRVMVQQGFKNYPAEWWHFAYGDRLWAAYSGLKKCFYGLVRG